MPSSYIYWFSLDTRKIGHLVTCFQIQTLLCSYSLLPLAPFHSSLLKPQHCNDTGKIFVVGICHVGLRLLTYYIVNKSITISATRLKLHPRQEQCAFTYWFAIRCKALLDQRLRSPFSSNVVYMVHLR